MGERITEKCQPTEDDEDSRHAADDPDQHDRDECVLHEGVLPGSRDGVDHEAWISIDVDETISDGDGV